MEPTSSQQFLLLKEDPGVVKAKALSVTALLQTGIDSVSSPAGASPWTALGNMKENCVGFYVLRLLQSSVVAHDMLHVSIGSIRDSYMVEPQRVLL